MYLWKIKGSGYWKVMNSKSFLSGYCKVTFCTLELKGLLGNVERAVQNNHRGNPLGMAGPVGRGEGVRVGVGGVGDN